VFSCARVLSLAAFQSGRDQLRRDGRRGFDRTAADSAPASVPASQSPRNSIRVFAWLEPVSLRRETQSESVNVPTRASVEGPAVSQWLSSSTDQWRFSIK
jgi:hypothetical protein